MSFFKQIITLITGEEVAPKKITERDLIRLESQIGAQLFGPLPKGRRREFFCLDAHTWIWYEEWFDEATKKKQSITTRYEIHEKSILKVQDGQPYKQVEGQELYNLVSAIRLYREHVVPKVYKRHHVTGQPLGQPATINR